MQAVVPAALQRIRSVHLPNKVRQNLPAAGRAHHKRTTGSEPLPLQAQKGRPLLNVNILTLQQSQRLTRRKLFSSKIRKAITLNFFVVFSTKMRLEKI